MRVVLAVVLMVVGVVAAVYARLPAVRRPDTGAPTARGGRRLALGGIAVIVGGGQILA